MEFIESVVKIMARNDGDLCVVTEATYVLEAVGCGDPCLRRVVFDSPVQAQFKNFDELTQNDLLNWCRSKIGVQEIMAMKIGLESKFLHSTNNEGSIEVTPPWQTNLGE